MQKNDFEKISLDLQRLAFNLSDAIDTLNFHSIHEAVADMRNDVRELGAEMDGQLKTLLRNFDSLKSAFPELPADLLLVELLEMKDLLEVLRKCTGDVKNHHQFIGSLPPLIELCEKWAAADPLRVQN